MRLVCPCCGAAASIEAWTNDANARSFMGVLTKLPREVQGLALPYIGLFRNGKRGLPWPKALRVLTELSRHMEPGTVQWDGCEVRPAPPALWARAIEAVLARSPEALGNHNYLKHTAWQLAKDLAVQAERDREVQIRRSAVERQSSEPVSAGTLAEAVVETAPRSRPRTGWTCKFFSPPHTCRGGHTGCIPNAGCETHEFKTSKERT